MKKVNLVKLKENLQKLSSSVSNLDNLLYDNGAIETENDIEAILKENEQLLMTQKECRQRGNLIKTLEGKITLMKADLKQSQETIKTQAATIERLNNTLSKPILA